jgi:hypothetical protein
MVAAGNITTPAATPTPTAKKGPIFVCIDNP